MGQCSTLPTEARQNDTSSTQGGTASASRNQDRDDQPTSAHTRYKEKGSSSNMTDSTDNSNTPPTARQQQQQQQQRPGSRRTTGTGGFLQVTVPQNNEASGTTHPQPVQFSHMQTHAIQPPASQMPQPMQEDEREGLPKVPTPDCVKRTRCYQLNLDSELVGISTDVRTGGNLLGPFAQDMPPLTYSASDDSSTMTDPTSVAIRTAQIFRGITVSKDGTILSQNARASRSNRGNTKVKRGEKSRQAAKIDKAKDLVEESLLTGKAPDSDEPANLVSLFIMGEYDEMTYLVRDGSKKLREATGLPDDALLAVNRQRGSLHGASMPTNLLSPSSRKRISPHLLNNNGINNPSATTFSPSKVRTSPPMPPSPHSAPPKIKGHPRDLPSTRRMSDDNRAGSRRFLPMQESCFGHQHGGNGDSDWSGALGLTRGFNSIWNCGGLGDSTISPTQMSAKEKGSHPMSPTGGGAQSHQNVLEGRNESNYNRMTSPGNNSERIDVQGWDAQAVRA